MNIIVGLGNPGDKYKYTRHNVGFIMLDWYLEGKPTIDCQSKFASHICEIHFAGNKSFFVKPQTFMNSSGEAVREILHFYKAMPNRDVLVVHDEKDLPFGTTRMGAGSSSAGHNGVQSIIDELGTKEFARIRIGIESRDADNQTPTDAFVLQEFTPEELKRLKAEVFPKVRDEIDIFLDKKK